MVLVTLTFLKGLVNIYYTGQKENGTKTFPLSLAF